jgi:Ser/Thr protein kinase RdoA (MazF antagonist)
LNQSDFFYNLTPFVVMEALERAGMKPDGSSLQLNSLENRVYDLGLEDSSHVVAKFYRPGRWNRKQIQEEHDFLNNLAREEIPVCFPLEFPTGGTIREIEGIYYALWPRTGGRQTDEFNSEELLMLGRYLGRIHSVGKTMTFKHRPLFNRKRMVDQSLDIIDALPLPRSLVKRYAHIANRGGDNYDRLIKDIPVHPLHGDCHIGNLLKNGQTFFFLDFDDALTGPAVQDIWMILGGDDNNYKQRQNFLIEGYRTFCDFEESWLQLIEPLRLLRMIYFAGWTAKRKDDPAFQHAFPQMGTIDYWEQEIIDMEQQLTRCPREEKIFPVNFTGFEENPEEELTNRDFFFDWEDDLPVR